MLKPDVRAPVGRVIPTDAWPALAVAGSDQRWRQLQHLRREGVALEPWIDALVSGSMRPDVDLLAALWGRLERDAVERLLGSEAGVDPQPWLAAGLIALPSLAARPAVRAAWLAPLLHRSSMALGPAASSWLQLAGHFRDPAVAEQLRLQLQRGYAAGLDPPALEPLLPLLGLQRASQDACLLQQWALAPLPRELRHAALEGLAVGLSAWPVEALARDLAVLAADLDPALAATAVDLLARLPQGQRRLRPLLAQSLDPGVRRRLQRRLQRRPLVLVVHGRQGGLIPQALRDLAAELEANRGVPVLLQALTANPPLPCPAFQRAAQRAGGVTLVPLLLLPGSHVRLDVPAIAAHWRARGPLRRVPFLGGWPAWQQALTEELVALGCGAEAILLHHPLEGPLAERYLRLLERRCGCRCAPTPYSATDLAAPALPSSSVGSGAVLPLALAANRLCERLQVAPLLQRPRLRQVLLRQLEDLP